jgi:hypothetical protein
VTVDGHSTGADPAAVAAPMGLTIFASPKPFQGAIEVIQKNALRSWAALRPRCEILLFGDEAGTREAARELQLRHVAAVERNRFGTPLVSSMFRQAEEQAVNPLLCYVNADIILTQRLLDTVARVASSLPAFLMAGRRIDLDLARPLDFAPGWSARLEDEAQRRGALHGPQGCDYFVFPRGALPPLPPFAVGRPGWDNYVVYSARKNRLPVVDATLACPVFHQNHEVQAYAQGWPRGAGAEALESWELAGHGARLLDLRDATHELGADGALRTIAASRFVVRKLFTLPLLYLNWGLPFRLLRHGRSQ